MGIMCKPCGNWKSTIEYILTNELGDDICTCLLDFADNGRVLIYKNNKKWEYVVDVESIIDTYQGK